LILIVTTRDHRYTHESLHRERGLDLDVVTYDQVLRRHSPHRATHIFTDLDRLSDWELHEAALIFRDLKSRGMTALNDPATFLGRYGMLRGLHRAGLNGFDVYRVDSCERPKRWPVFLRLEGNHAAPVSGLLQNENELEEALESAVAQGAPKSALLIIEYAAEPIRPGVFRKLSVFRVGNRFLGYTCVHEDSWIVKYGKAGVASDEMYEEEHALVRDNPFAEAVKPAFDLAGLDYGRVDFGLVDGKPQIYEINNNPFVDLSLKPEAASRRRESSALFRENYLQAMSEIDSFPRPTWQASSAALARTVRHSPPRIRRLAVSVIGKAIPRKREEPSGSLAPDQA
jgi:hypothetical protein